MELSQLERRKKILEMADADEDYRRIYAEYTRTKDRFEKYTKYMPRALSNCLWSYPGMLYFLHHRLLTLVSESMRFPEENNAN